MCGGLRQGVLLWGVRVWSYIVSNLGGEQWPRKKIVEVELDVDMIVVECIVQVGVVRHSILVL